MSSNDALEGLLPHAGRMRLLERLLDWDADRVRLSTASHRSPDNPLRNAGRLRALHLCEYGAQAMAIHGGLAARAAGGVPKPGLLVSLRAVQLLCDDVQALPGELLVEAERLQGGESGWQYTFRVSHAGVLLAEGRAAVIARPATPES
jgi:predicted hotdog family 3-hydroxylacyl-ACP dehydratase